MSLLTGAARLCSPDRPARRFCLLGVILAGVSAAPFAHAGQFGVRVVDPTGEPVAGASVCVGLEGNYKQFGALFTDLDGSAIVEVPNVPLVVTVSKTRFAGVRLAEPARGFDLIKQVTLTDGVPGPRCRAGSTVAETEPGGAYQGVRIDGVSVEVGASRTLLQPRASGEPTHYRVSNEESFADAEWLRFERSIALPGSLVDKPSVYLQLRRYQGTARGWLEALSAVATVRLPTP